VAVLGFENLARDPDLAYIETSLVRMLPSELAAGERLRLVPSEQVDRARRDYGLAGGGSGLDRDTLERLRGRLGADFVIIGSYLARRRAGARGAERIRCVVAIQDAHSGAIIASLRQEGTEEGLLDLIDALGMQLRDHLGVGNLSPAEEVAARNARPANARAARLYAEGLEKLSRFETLAAKDLLEQARDADPDNALIRADLAAAWRTLGWPVPAAEAAREALRLSAGLGYESRRRVEARSAETTRDWKGAATLYGELWTRFPDDFEYGLGLARSQIQTGDTKAALLTVERLRASPQPWHDEPRIDLTEADAALRLGDSAHAVEIALRAERKAEAQGAPILAARALFFQGAGLRYLGRLVEAREAGERARERFQKAGDLASAAAALTTVGSVLSQQGENAAARRAFEETVAIGRAIGNEETSGIGLINIGVTRSESGDLEGARKSYEEALAIFRRIGSKPRVAMIAVNLARVDQRLGQRAQARALDEEMATTLRELGNRDSEATVLANLAVLALEEGKLKEASDLTSRALKLHQEIGGAAGVAEDRGLQGQVLALRGDLPAAQRELEAAAAGLTAGGEKLWAARLRIELARVLVEAGQPAEAEAMAHAALSALGGKPAPDDELAARTVLTLASLTQGHRDVAAAEVQRAAAPLAACQYQAVRLQAVLAAARVHAAAGQTQPAAGELRAVLAEAERTGLRPLALETRLALGELEGDGAARREQLSAAAREAAAAGYSGLARRAKAALSRGPS
jgi:tetratricopeptide (TPR) repeat protein